MLNFLCTLLKVYLARILSCSPPLSMYALEGAVEFPPASGLFVYVLYMCCICNGAFCVCVCVFVYLSESLLGGSPPLSMYALEVAVECPHTQG